MKFSTFVIMAFTLVLLTGCVTVGKYKMADQERQDLALQKEMLAARVDSLVSEVRLLSKTLDEQKSLLVKELGQKNLDITQKQEQYDQLSKELEEKTALMNAKNDSLKAQTADYDKRLAELQAKQTQYENIVRDKEKENQNYQALMNSLKSELNQKSVTIQNLQGKLTVTFVNEVLFESGSAAISKQGKDILDDFATGMKDNTGYRIDVIGHTDNVPITGNLAKTYPTNWELSTARAVSVVRYLTEKADMSPDELYPEGHSYYSPVMPNDSSENRAKNRRVEIVIAPIAKTSTEK
jgi:chemotaxis protein MotB